jgi:type I restriction enzyme S subunit
MEVRTGYRQTEVGVIPEDWEVSTVGAEFSIQLGKMLDSEKNTGVPKPYIGNRAVQWGRIELKDMGFIKMTPSDLQRFRLQNGDLLVCEGGEIGRAAIWKKEIPECYYQKALHRLRSNRGYRADLLLRMLERWSATGFLTNFVTQTSIAHLPKDKFEKVPLPLPGKAEQEAIAEALSDADAFIQSLEQLIAKKRQIKQGAMQELLTGKRRLQGFANAILGYKQTEAGVIPEDWELDQVENIAHITTGSKNTQDRVDEGQYPFFVRSQIVERINSYSFDGEAVLTAGDGVGTGKVFHYINGKFDAHQRVYRITDFSERVNGYFFYLYFSSRFYNRIMQMTAKSSVDSVRREMIAKMLIPFPPTKAEQEAISETLSDMDAEVAALEEKLAKARQIKQGMMHNLLTGRIRLI